MLHRDTLWRFRKGGRLNILATYARMAWEAVSSLSIGPVILLVYVVLAVFAPLVTPYSPTEIDAAAAFQPPSWTHLFGTDELGRDIWTRAIHGARISLATGIPAALLAASVGIPLGLVAGYVGSAFDAATMRLIDVITAVPAILLAMILIVLAGPGLAGVIVAVGVTAIPAFSRLTRAATLALRKQDFVTACRALGGSNMYVMTRVILPNALGPLKVQLIITTAVAVLLEAALSFLGLGVQPPTPSWGGMLQTAKGFLHIAPYYAILPGALLTGLVLALDMTGRTLRGKGTVEVAIREVQR